MDFNKEIKKVCQIDKETGKDEISALLDELNSDLEDDIDNF